MFFTASPRLYKKGIIHLLPVKAKDVGDNLLNKLNDVLKKWIKGQIIGFFFIAILTGLGLWLLGIPLVFTLALIAGLLNFIPNFGPIIAFHTCRVARSNARTRNGVIGYFDVHFYTNNTKCGNTANHSKKNDKHATCPHYNSTGSYGYFMRLLGSVACYFQS